MMALRRKDYSKGWVMRMKKVLGFLAACAFGLLLPVSLSADMVVKSVSGSPKAKNGGSTAALKAGTKVQGSTVIVTGASDSVVLEIDGKEVKVGANSSIAAGKLGKGMMTSDKSKMLTGRVQKNVNNSVASVAGVRAEKSDSHAPFSHFRTPGAVTVARAGSAPGKYAEAQAAFNRGDYKAAKDIASALTGDATVGANALFLKGMASFNLLDYSDAAAAFENAFGRGLDSEKAPVALLYIGISRYNISDNAGSNKALYGFIDKYPNHADRAVAMYHVALNFMELNDVEKAKSALTFIIKNFSSDPIAKAAQEDLAKL